MTARTPSFPDTEAFARAFYTEAVRHLEDAKLLYEANRPAASITSTMKASELGTKAAFILDNAAGYYEKVYTTHKPLTDAATHPVLNRIPTEIETLRAGLISQLRGLEQLEPTQFGKKGFGPEEANTEYPFLTLTTDTSGNKFTVLQSPALYFSPANSLDLYRLAQELLTLLPTLYPVITSWSIVLPPAL